MTQRLHPVFGGERVDPRWTSFRGPGNRHIVGILPTCAAVFDARKAGPRRSVEDARRRSVVAHLHRPLDEEPEGSAAVEPGT